MCRTSHFGCLTAVATFKQHCRENRIINVHSTGSVTSQDVSLSYVLMALIIYNIENILRKYLSCSCRFDKETRHDEVVS